jgi:DNA-binding NtrC family response regulator
MKGNGFKPALLDKGVKAMAEESEISILIVDDDDAVLNLLTQLLSNDYTCITASTAHEAMMLLSRSFFNVVITDVFVPDTSGTNLCDFIQRNYSDTVVIAVSGMMDRERMMQHGTFDCIAKPFDIDQVAMSVRRALSYQKLKRHLT